MIAGVLLPFLAVGCALSEAGPDPADPSEWSHVSHDGPLRVVADSGFSSLYRPKGWDGEDWWGTFGYKVCTSEPAEVRIRDVHHEVAIEPVRVVAWLRVVPAASSPVGELTRTEGARRLHLGTSLGSPVGQENQPSVTLASGTGDTTYDGRITPLVGAVHEFEPCDHYLEGSSYQVAEPFSEVWISLKSGEQGSHISSTTFYYEYEGKEYGVRTEWQIAGFGDDGCASE